MAYEKKIPQLGCADEHIRELLMGRWKIKLLHFIASGVKRPGELQKRIPEASRRVLDIQLAQLVKHELILKTSFDEPVPRVEYELTDLGKSLFPLLQGIIKWGHAHKEKLDTVTSR